MSVRRKHIERKRFTQDAHDVFAVLAGPRVDRCTLLAEDLPAVLPEEVVEVAHAGVWIHGDVSGQLEDRLWDVVPASAE